MGETPDARSPGGVCQDEPHVRRDVEHLLGDRERCACGTGSEEDRVKAFLIDASNGHLDPILWLSSGRGL